jgi:fatty-acyl-CoA synthase
MEEPRTQLLSYSRGADAPLIEKTISQVLAGNAQRWPDRDALIARHQNVRLTWSELDREATRTARGLAGLGLRPGDRAGIWAANYAEWVLLLYGAALAGVTLVSVNPAYRSHELRYVLRHSKIRALFLLERKQEISERGLEAVARVRTA